jgi:chromosome partitioning protein
MQIMACQVRPRRDTLEDMFIAFTNTKGGVGKSTLSCHLGIWLFDRGYRVALLDTDPQVSSSEWMRNAEPKITVCVTSDSDAIQVALKELMAVHDFVIADAPGEEGGAANAVTMLADLAVLPLEPTKLCVRALKDALKTIRLAHAVRQGRPETVLVLNKVRMKSVRAAKLKKQLRTSGFRVAEHEVRWLDAIAESCDSAVTREKSPTFAGGASDMEALFMELLGQHLAEKSAANE